MILGGIGIPYHHMYSLKDISAIRSFMLSHGHTLAVAESVTSGHLQAALSLATEASNFFHGGITAYNLGQKARHLHIDPIRATSCNSVSQFIAEEMALNALTFFSSDWAIGITGYASKVPELGIDNLFAYYAIAFRKEVVDRGKVECDSDDAYEVQVIYTNHVLKKLSAHVTMKIAPQGKATSS